MNGLIFSVKRYCIHDGPGIRVTIFMKGCPLRCLWCHNPEGISPFTEKVTRSRKIGDKEFRSTEEAGKYFSPESIVEILDKERVFINQSGGGVTFSGGEPMLQTGFLLDALKKCKEAGFNTAVDTSGYSSTEYFKSIMKYTDLFLFDLKHLDEKKHIESTGVSNRLIRDNYRLILKRSKNVFLRIPVIPGYNDDTEHLERLRQFISYSKTSSLKKINLLPYHRTGSSKYKTFNIQYVIGEIEPPSKERMMELKDFFSDTGIEVKIGG